MSERIYKVVGDRITLANAATTLAWLRPNATVPVEILRVWASQAGASTSQQFPLQLVTQAVSAASGFTSLTPRATNKGNTQANSITGGTTQAAGTSGIANATSVESGGARTVLVPDSFNSLTGYVWVPANLRSRIILPANFADIFGLFLPEAPGASFLTKWTFGITFGELV